MERHGTFIDDNNILAANNSFSVVEHHTNTKSPSYRFADRCL